MQERCLQTSLGDVVGTEGTKEVRDAARMRYWTNHGLTLNELYNGHLNEV